MSDNPDDMEGASEETEVSRRQFLKMLGVGAGVSAMGVTALNLDGVKKLAEVESIRDEVESPQPSFSHSSTDMLVSASSGTYHAVSDGSWNDPNVWDEGEVPVDGANVIIESGTSVELQGTTNRMHEVRVKGTFKVDPTTDTHLKVDTLKSDMGSTVHIGTPSNPIQQGNEARITFIDTGPIDEDLDPKRKSRGFLGGGEWRLHGQEKTTWTELSSHPTAGDTTIDLPQEPTNWSAGDRIVIPGVDAFENQDEERTIDSVNGSTVHLDSALEHDHVPPKSSLDSYVLNLSRNVILESENLDELRRGHVMAMGKNTDFKYIRFNELGRTNKDRFLTNPVRGEEHLPDGMDPNPAARYPLHWHRIGSDAEKPQIVEGVVVDGGPGWGIVNHHAYVNVRDSITYGVRGSGFVTEGGNERGSFRRCFALRSEGSGENIDSRAAGQAGGDPPIDDFGHAGHGFWMQSPLTEVTDCVAAGHRHAAFVWWLRPLLDKPEETLAEESCAGGEIDDSRVTDCPNVPMKYVDQERQAPMLEAIEQGRFNNDELMRETQKVPSNFVAVKKIKGNEAFASAAGVDFSRHSFKWIHERFSDFSTIEDMTVHSIGKFVDENGNEYSFSLPRHRGTTGASSGIHIRYSSNVKLKNCHLVGPGRQDTVGVPFHDYQWTTVTEGCTIENWDWGIDTGEHRVDWVRNNVFRDNNYDVYWGFDNVGPAILTGNSLQRARHMFTCENQKAGEVLGFGQKRGMRIDGRSVHVKESEPDYVPFPDSDSLGCINNIESTVPSVDNKENLVGLTNAEMLDQFGVCISGHVMPDDAVNEPYIEGSKLGPRERDPPTSVFLDSVNADQLGMFEVVTEDDVARGKCLRCTGSSSPEDNPASISFDSAAGTYKIFFRFRPDAWNGDYLKYRIDGGDWYTAEKMKTPRGFRWHAASPNNEPAYEHQLSEGSHTLEFACGNDDVKLDEIFITSDATVLGAYGMSTGSSTEQPKPEPEEPEIVDFGGSCQTE